MAQGRKFVAFNTLQSLYSQIPVTFLNIGLVIWAVRNMYHELDFTQLFWGYLITAALFNLVYLIYSIIGAVKSHKGIFFYFLFFGKLAYHQVYKIKENESKTEVVNQPPM